MTNRLALKRVLDALVRLGQEPEQMSNREIEAGCPACETGYLRIALGRGDRVLMFCTDRCSTEEIVAALGLRMRDLFEHRRDSDTADEGRAS